jgi:hypothetical protein
MDQHKLQPTWSVIRHAVDVFKISKDPNHVALAKRFRTSEQQPQQ